MNLFKPSSYKRPAATSIASAAQPQRVPSASTAMQRFKNFFSRKPRGAKEASLPFSFDSDSAGRSAALAAEPALLAPQPAAAGRASQALSQAAPCYARGTAPVSVAGTKYPLAATRTQQGEKLRVALLQADDGQSLIISQTLDQGSFGKFRLAIDANHQVFAVKEFRSELFKRLPLYNHEGKEIAPKTRVTHIFDIQEEMEMGWTLQSDIRIDRLIDVKGKMYALMPYMDGGDDLRLLARLQPRLQHSRTERSALTYGLMRSIGAELGSWHRKGYIHSDIKPDNVLISSKQLFALGDLGGATRLNSNGVAVGKTVTQNYMSPEQRASPHLPHTAAVDVFAFGVTIMDTYVSALGMRHTPFAGRDAITWFKHVRIVLLDALRDRVHSSLEHVLASDMGKIFNRMLRDDPQLGEFVLRHVLNPEPSLRASAEDIAAFAKRQMTAKYEEHLYDMLEIDPDADTREQAVLSALKAQWDKLLYQGPPVPPKVIID